MSSLDRILPFLRPIEDLLRDPRITEVMVNQGGTSVFVERDGRLDCESERRLESRNLSVAIKNIARACGDEISELQPVLDARLEDGSRVAAMFPPCAVGGAALERFLILRSKRVATVLHVVGALVGQEEGERRLDQVADVVKRAGPGGA
jgi:Flp pilus assembly CpaF family ATPase